MAAFGHTPEQGQRVAVVLASSIAAVVFRSTATRTAKPCPSFVLYAATKTKLPAARHRYSTFSTVILIANP